MPRKKSMRQRRPGLRPPRRFLPDHGTSRAKGFNALGLGPAYKILLPPLQGPFKKAFFNQASAWTLVVLVALGALLGAALLGPAGGILGACVGLTGGGRFLLKERYYRP